jgi:hypothetical protein
LPLETLGFTMFQGGQGGGSGNGGAQRQRKSTSQATAGTRPANRCSEARSRRILEVSK